MLNGFHFLCKAMVHELIGIQDNKVDLRNIGKVPKDQQVVVLFPCITCFVSYFEWIIWWILHLKIHDARRLCYHPSRMHSSKIICMKILEILEWISKKWLMIFSKLQRATRISRLWVCTWETCQLWSMLTLLAWICQFMAYIF